MSRNFRIIPHNTRCVCDTSLTPWKGHLGGVKVKATGWSAWHHFWKCLNQEICTQSTNTVSCRDQKDTGKIKICWQTGRKTDRPKNNMAPKHLIQKLRDKYTPVLKNADRADSWTVVLTDMSPSPTTGRRGRVWRLSNKQH